MNEIKRLSVKEIIDETVDYYKTHLRGSNDERCFYFAEYHGLEEPVMCAIGRCLISPRDFEHVTKSVTFLAQTKGLTNFDELLKPEYHGHPTVFWAGLQFFHDKSCYWIKTETGNEVSATGKKELASLMREFK